MQATIEDPDVQLTKRAGKNGRVYLGDAVEGETVRVVGEVVSRPLTGGAGIVRKVAREVETGDLHPDDAPARLRELDDQLESETDG